MSGMFALSLLLAATAAPAEQPAAPLPGEDEEILVIAHRLDAVTLNIRRDDRGRMSCATIESSGEPELDGKLCKAAVGCIRKEGWAEDAIRKCVADSKPALLADMRAQLRERRVQNVEESEEEPGT